MHRLESQHPSRLGRNERDDGRERHDRLARFRQFLEHVGDRMRAIARSVTPHLPKLTVERAYWVGFVLVMLLYLYLLLTQPTGAGRGGR